MRIILLPVAVFVCGIGTMPAAAQSNPRDTLLTYGRQADPGAVRDQRAVGDWRQFRNFDYDHYERGQSTYFADRYYRNGRYYKRQSLDRNDRIYRGSNNRYYCRRSDGTTGLIVGGIAGGAIGNMIARGESQPLGTLIGAGGGALLGQSIDRGQVVCH